MLIESHLPQFNHERALLIVAGEAAAKLYKVSNGEISELDVFALPKLRYSDREGFFTRGGKSTTSTTGSVYETPKQYLHSQFLRGLQDDVLKAHDQWHFNAVYLFAPSYMAKAIKDMLGKEFENLNRMTISGNMVRKRPFELLRLIADREQEVRERRRHITQEVQRLLKGAVV